MRSIAACAKKQSHARLSGDADGGNTDAVSRERAIERIVELMRRGLPVGGRRFTREEMHER